MRRAAPSLLWLLLRVIALVSTLVLVRGPKERSLALDGVSHLVSSDACAIGAARPASRVVLRLAPVPAPRTLPCASEGAFSSRFSPILTPAGALNPAPRRDVAADVRRRLPVTKLEDPPGSSASLLSAAA
jgi:hypothetical protein